MNQKLFNIFQISKKKSLLFVITTQYKIAINFNTVPFPFHTIKACPCCFQNKNYLPMLFFFVALHHINERDGKKSRVRYWGNKKVAREKMKYFYAKSFLLHFLLQFFFAFNHSISINFFLHSIHLFTNLWYLTMCMSYQTSEKKINTIKGNLFYLLFFCRLEMTFMSLRKKCDLRMFFEWA